MQMLKKIFKSDPKYYLELDELKDSEVVQTAVKTAEKTAEVVKETAAKVASSEPVQGAVKAAGEIVETAQEKLASVPTDAKPAPTKSVKPKATATKNKAAQNGKAAKGAKPTVQAKPQSSGASSYDPPFWVAAMSKTNTTNSNGNGQGGEATFATDNLLPTATKYRRRPGGSLAKFRDMAKTAKTPRR